MIGLEYILNLYNVTQQQLADELDIRKQNISQWVKGGRKIPKKYLEYLSDKFKISVEYFTMQLKKSDELKIKIMKLIDENPPRKVTIVRNDKEWGRHEYEKEVYDEAVEKELVLLKVEIEKQKLLEKIYEMINFTKKVYNLKTYVDENIKICSVFDCLISILKSQKVEPDVLMEIFNAVILAYGIDEGIDIRPLVRHLQFIFKGYEFDKNLNYSVLKKVKAEIGKDNKENGCKDSINDGISDDDLRKVYVTENGNINFDWDGRLANINDVEEFTVKTGKIIRGILVLADGKFTYNGNNIDEKGCKYKLVSKDKPKLYAEFLNDVDRDFEEIIKCTFDDDDRMFIAITRLMNKDWMYVYNYWFEEDKIESSKNMVPSEMLQLNLD